MIKLELYVEELDYESLVETLMPLVGEKMKGSGNPIGNLLSAGMPISMVQGVIGSLPKAKKDKMAADFINSRADDVCRKLENTAKKHGIDLELASIHAEVK